MEKFKKQVKKLIGNVRKVTLRNKDFTIISNNCWGGFIYQRFNLEYKSPFIGLFLFAEDYINLLEDFDNLIFNNKLKFISADNSKYKEKLIELKTFNKYPIATLGDDIEIHFLHYHSEEEARGKWEKRVKRINRNNILVKFCDRDLCNDNLIERFDKLNFSNKICFAAKEYPDYNSVITFKEYLGCECIENELETSKRYLNITKMLNNLK